MLELKGVDTRVTLIPEGFHPVVLRARGFQGITVPGVKLDSGERIQTSLAVSRRLDELLPDGPLLHSSAEVTEAERWADAELQSVPRRIFRWATTEQPWLREWIARQAGLPAPGLAARVGGLQARAFARQAGASRERATQDLEQLPAKLDRVDELLSTGVIGDTTQPNAADFQILSTVKSLLGFEDLAHFAAGRPAEAPARALFPDWPAATVPSFLPPELRSGGAGARA